MASSVIYTDLELFLTDNLATRLAGRPEPYCTDVVVGREFTPADLTPPERLVVIRDDSGPTTSRVTKDVSVGITVMATTLQDAKALALMVQALLPGCIAVVPGNPIAAFTGSNGPYSTPNPTGVPTQYLTAGFTVVGNPF